MAKGKSGSGPGHIELPSKEELAKLPHRAMIAFAARCARRVQPLFKHRRPDAPKEHVEVVDRMISLVEQSAVHPISMSDLDEAVNAAAELRSAPAFSATAAANAAKVVTARATHGALHHAASAGDQFSLAIADPPMRRDYELLKAAAEREQWTDETPVPPEFFGPLWPDGEPDGWPVESASPTFKGKPMFAEDEAALRLHFAIPAEMDREEADRIMQDIIIAANELHLAYGGSGLTIADRIRVYEPALVPAGGDE